jgi:hypothetical protein
MDTVPPFRLSPETFATGKVRVLDASPLLADVVRRLYAGDEVEPLTEAP